MKRTMLALAVCAAAFAAADAAAATLAWQLSLIPSQLRLEPGRAGNLEARIDGWPRLAWAAEPCLPYRIVNLVIPQGEEVVSCRVEQGRSRRSAVAAARPIGRNAARGWRDRRRPTGGRGRFAGRIPRRAGRVPRLGQDARFRHRVVRPLSGAARRGRGRPSRRPRDAPDRRNGSAPARRARWNACAASKASGNRPRPRSSGSSRIPRRRAPTPSTNGRSIRERGPSRLLTSRAWRGARSPIS